ncbi:MAG: single-stranded-DNA-specific exonuclease RecJ [Sutterellaceae bacterium]|nr:single-stranded-DNA-specific exonuclease RecJ [Burkholderiaceae bacterium]MCX7901947.1 single-stranded-DNA-specific exonuclease RecJ [Burkholderiaceae bacterium]MDW8429879.1 single-stranded-DNA-specific exonuclease RecJ [Sutterellaceae bacterium]
MKPRFVARAYDPAAAQRLAASGLPVPLARVLAARGIVSPRELELSARALLTPDALADVDKAARLLADAIEAGQRLLIVADYDCDGATACAVAVRGLRAFGADVDYLVPNRFKYGYGLTPEIVDLAAARRPRPDLLITVDNGIASVEGVAHANALGLRVLITDHHLPAARLPAAAAIVNPNQPGCGFPSKHLAGVGVMFYVLAAVRAELRRRGRFDAASQPRLDELLPLVALGTVADVVRLDYNNRILVAEGLRRIRAGRMPAGMAALFQVAGCPARSAQVADLGFALAPRINAAGRLADMSIGIECLLTDDNERALALAVQLDALNRQRRDIETQMQLDADSELQDAALAGRRSIVLFNEAWHQGVIGLVAARIKERYHRPTIAFARIDEGTLRGSGRSIEGVHLRDALDLVTKIAPFMIEKFGGHALAAGLTLKAAHFGSFCRAFEAALHASADAALFERTVRTDGPLSPQDFTLGLVESLESQIWGQGFDAPLFDNEFVIVEQRLVKEEHLRLTVELAGRRLPAIWFRRAEPLPSRARLAYRLAADEYQGLRRVQLLIEHAA